MHEKYNITLYFLKLIFIGVLLLVSTVQQSESAYIYIPPPFGGIFFPFRSPESIEFPVLY